MGNKNSIEKTTSESQTLQRLSCTSIDVPISSYERQIELNRQRKKAQPQQQGCLQHPAWKPIGTVCFVGSFFLFLWNLMFPDTCDAIRVFGDPDKWDC